jgi:hypothetical protein
MDLAGYRDWMVQRCKDKLATTIAIRTQAIMMVWAPGCPLETFFENTRSPCGIGVSALFGRLKSGGKSASSYKVSETSRERQTGWWARQDSNLRQHRYERRVLTN